jgi:two-component system response regulator AtoC
LAGLLYQLGYAPVIVHSPSEAAAAIGQGRFAFSLVDVDLNGDDPSALLRQLKPRGDDSDPVIMVLDDRRADRGAELRMLGADEVLARPVERADLERVVQAVLGRVRRLPARPVLDDPGARLETEVGLWRSPTMREVWNIIEQAAQIDITVLVTGETGTGKDLVARAIHHRSSRQGYPFVKVNCAAVPRELLESELFGHERGAFTGAHQMKMGKFESAHQGTIFLDEIGDLHPALQAKLLHVLQDGEFSRVGGKSTIKVDVRVIAATNQDLERAVAAGHFREDLYYRLNVIQIEVPPLRERTEEVPGLVDYFLRRYSRLYRREGFTVPPRVLERLLQHNYQGNVRELENIVKRMIVLNDPYLTKVTLPRTKAEPHRNGAAENGGGEPQAIPLKEVVREAALAAERRAIAKVLEQTRWNRVKAAKLLNISYRALLYKIKHVGLERERPSSRFTV